MSLLKSLRTKLKQNQSNTALSTLFKLRKQSPQKNQVNDHQKPVVAHDLLFLPDFLFPVFSCLDRKSVFTVRQVCQQWNAVGRQFISLRTHWQDNLTQFQKRAIIMQLKLFDTLEIIDGDDSWVKFCDFAGETNAMAESSRRSNGAISNDLLIGLQALSAAEDPNTYNDEGCKGQARSGGQRSRLRKLVVTRAQRYEKRLQDLLGVLPMLTSLELVDLIITKIEMHSILSSTPNLQRFIVEYTLGDVVSWDPPMSNDTQQSTSTTTSIAGSPTRSAYIHGLETLIIRHAAMDQVSLESLCEALPRLTELEVRFLHLTPIDGSDGVFSRKSFYQSLARSCPRIESLHFSLYHREMNVEESVALQHSFPALKELSMAGKDLDDIGLGHQIKLLEYYTNYLTKLEILCYSARHGNRFLERFHQFLCSARHLRHLIAPKLQYWTEYMDLEEINNSNHDTDDSGNSRGNGQVYYRPRDDAHRQYMEWKIPARRWACRDLETLHLGFTARFGSSTDAEHSRIMFGYISRYCPQLRDLQINKQMLNLHIDGGLCLLTRLKHLEKLKIVSRTKLFNLKSSDVDWIGYTISKNTGTMTTVEKNGSKEGSSSHFKSLVWCKRKNKASLEPSQMPIENVFAMDQEWHKSRSQGRTSSIYSDLGSQHDDWPFSAHSESARRCWPQLRSFVVLGADPGFFFKNSADADLIARLRPDINFRVQQWESYK